ncbi:hypothetical protein OPT61_g10056 [Boeremia exigua]|uniref:Uncharacterized protein n=1 Tax=Boeremia exigua TaxID=749465 RepID=A0ACC2HRD7_9PLEO|nr:hypothetical protein OPT61_g10056 [Boeremia exigua]
MVHQSLQRRLGRRAGATLPHAAVSVPEPAAGITQLVTCQGGQPHASQSWDPIIKFTTTSATVRRLGRRSTGGQKALVSGSPSCRAVPHRYQPLAACNAEGFGSEGEPSLDLMCEIA